ncbi:MAG: MaoC family dehydratase [Desulfovibrionaceae bacterium]|nr:MaoC family dehydratase [Desulfovibrionaceae bacterium]
MDARLFLEDLYVGQTFISGTFHLDEQQVIDFATIYDPQVFHTDPEKATDSFFKGHAASGWQTAAVTMHLIVTSIPIDCGIIGIGGDLTWLRPVRPGDTLKAESKVTNIQISKSKPDRGVVSWLVETKNQHDEVVQNLTTKILVFRKKP